MPLNKENKPNEGEAKIYLLIWDVTEDKARTTKKASAKTFTVWWAIVDVVINDERYSVLFCTGKRCMNLY